MEHLCFVLLQACEALCAAPPENADFDAHDCVAWSWTSCGQGRMHSLHHTHALTTPHPCTHCATPIHSLHHTHALTAPHPYTHDTTPMHSLHHTHALTGLGRCWLKNLLGESERDDALPGSPSLRRDETFSCSGVKAYAAPSAENFPPPDNFTSFGYLQHPYHRVRHHSGIVRAHDRFNGVALIASSSPSHDPTATVPSATLMVASAGAKGVLLTVMATTHSRTRRY